MVRAVQEIPIFNGYTERPNEAHLHLLAVMGVAGAVHCSGSRLSSQETHFRSCHLDLIDQGRACASSEGWLAMLASRQFRLWPSVDGNGVTTVPKLPTSCSSPLGFEGIPLSIVRN